MEFPAPKFFASAGDAPDPAAGPTDRQTQEPTSAMQGSAEFAAIVDRALADCRRRRAGLAVLLVKAVYIGLPDASGHVLKQAAPKVEHGALDKMEQRMQRLVRACDSVVRIDSRNIGVTLAASGRHEALLVEDRAQQALVGPYRLDADQLELRLVVGHATYPEHGGTGRELVRAASRGPLSGGLNSWRAVPQTGVGSTSRERGAGMPIAGPMRSSTPRRNAMSQDYGIATPAAHNDDLPAAQPARYLVMIDSGGSALARLFLDSREQVAEFDAGADEVSMMSAGLKAEKGADGPEWDQALAGHSAAERREADVYTLDI